MLHRNTRSRFPTPVVDVVDPDPGESAARGFGPGFPPPETMFNDRGDVLLLPSEDPPDDFLLDVRWWRRDSSDDKAALAPSVSRMAVILDSPLAPPSEPLDPTRPRVGTD